jgi:hypothetical protein
MSLLRFLVGCDRDDRAVAPESDGKATGDEDVTNL